MQNIFIEKIKDKQLTKTQNKIAEYFVLHHHAILQKSLVQIAKDLDVSDVSVLRFVRSIGYEGYNDLKQDLYKHIEENMESISLTTRLGLNEPSQDNNEPLNKYMEMTARNIERSLKQNNQDSYNQVVELLEASHRKYIIGFRGGKAPALQLSRTLNFIVDDVFEIVHDSPDAYMKLEALKENDFVILFSFVRHYKMDVDISRHVKKRGAKICVITDTATSTVAKKADIVLLVNNKNISFFNSVMGVSAINEYLLIQFANRNRKSIKRRLNNYDALTKEYRY